MEGSKAALADEKTLAEVDLTADQGIVLTVKDLGPQISWQTVFFVEYVCFSHPPPPLIFL